MSRIEQIIDEIEEYVEDAKAYPLSSSKIIVNKEELNELITELRLQIPEEVKQYQRIIQNQDAILNDARSQADAIVGEANKLTEQLVDEHEIMQKAYNNANQIIENANAQAQIIVNNAAQDAANMKASVMKYSDDMLAQIQAIMNHIMDTADGKFETFMTSMKQNYDIVSQNRNELNAVNTDENRDQFQ